MKFEKEVLFPAAGIDAQRADEYYAVQDLMKELDYAVNEAARRLINGEIDESAAVQWLQKYAVMEPARAQQRVKFIQRYRSYVINYNLGEDMVRTLHRETKRHRSRKTVERIRQTPFLATITERIAVGFPGDDWSSAIYENFGRSGDVDGDQAGRYVVGRTDRYRHTGTGVARRGGIVSQDVSTRRERTWRDRVSDSES